MDSDGLSAARLRNTTRTADTTAGLRRLPEYDPRIRRPSAICFQNNEQHDARIESVANTPPTWNHGSIRGTFPKAGAISSVMSAQTGRGSKRGRSRQR